MVLSLDSFSFPVKIGLSLVPTLVLVRLSVVWQIGTSRS